MFNRYGERKAEAFRDPPSMRVGVHLWQPLPDGAVAYVQHHDPARWDDQGQEHPLPPVDVTDLVARLADVIVNDDDTP